MNTITRIATLALLTMTGTISGYAQKTKCTDPSVTFTISSSYTDPFTGQGYNSAILPDKGGAYVGGQNGVSAVLKTCEGTNDAILTPGKSRTVSINLHNAVSTSSQTPSWTNNTVGAGGINVWNLLYSYQPQSYYTFTTGIGVPGVDSPVYYYRLENPSRQAGGSTDPGTNSPCATALVNVAHYPAAYLSPTSPETWYVWPDSTPTTCASGQTAAQVGTLFLYTSSFQNVGQFTTPFFITIQRQ